MKRAARKPTITSLQKQLRLTRKQLREAQHDATHQQALVAYLLLNPIEDALDRFTEEAALNA